MKAKALGKNRKIVFTDIPAHGEFEAPSRIVISLNYIDDDDSGRVQKAIALDNTIIPKIVDLVNKEHYDATLRLEA